MDLLVFLVVLWIWLNVPSTPPAPSTYIQQDSKAAPSILDPTQRRQASLDPPLVNDPSSPPQKWHNAFASLCVGDSIVYGTLVLFYSLKLVNSKADLVALTHNLSSTAIDKLHRFGVRTYPVEPLSVETYMLQKAESMEMRDTILWSKLRAWQLEDYEKVIMLDSDLLVLKNLDELFQMPELAGSPMSDPKEKIQFFKTSEYGLRVRNKVDRHKTTGLQEGWSGLNSGVTVIQPNNGTFTKMLNELSIIPNRPCCPSQEFIFHYFEERLSYHRIPFIYNTRASDGDGGKVTSNTKVYHFVGAKPWKKKDRSKFNLLWWTFRKKVEDIVDR
ncbi:hypothetical protein HDV05_001306 [Chytridiales sp. JEL 0842]|nr:hypothetical protein HDV05_001306 [Chytridiales sp. JEL 0842]